jgi:hypothetical protein
VNTAAKWSIICTVTPDGSREQHRHAHATRNTTNDT